MPRSSSIEQLDGTPVVVTCATGSDAAELRAEADRLCSAAHPGVVRVLSSQGDDHRWELRTEHAGRSLEVGGPLQPATLAAVMASVSTTLADLHDLGVVHGRLTPSHVLIGPSGRPLICGLGPSDRGPDGTCLTPLDDVAAIGEIIIDQLRDQRGGEPIPERRWPWRRQSSGWVRAALLNLADQACAEPATRRPSARRLASTISAAIPSEADAASPRALPSVEAPEEDPGPLHRLRSMARAGAAEGRGTAPRDLPIRRLAAGGLAAIALLGTFGLIRAGGAESSSPALQPTPQPAAPTTTRSAPDVSSRCPGRGCASAARVDAAVHGNIVTTDRGRFEVGQPGDEVVVGDWDCDGTATPAVLRPATGEVFVFGGWASDGEVAVLPARTIPGARALVTSEVGDGCSTLAAERGPGNVVVITSAGAR